MKKIVQSGVIISLFLLTSDSSLFARKIASDLESSQVRMPLDIRQKEQEYNTLLGELDADDLSQVNKLKLTFDNDLKKLRSTKHKKSSTHTTTSHKHSVNAMEVHMRWRELVAHRLGVPMSSNPEVDMMNFQAAVGISNRNKAIVDLYKIYLYKLKQISNNEQIGRGKRSSE